MVTFVVCFCVSVCVYACMLARACVGAMWEEKASRKWGNQSMKW